MPGLLDYVKGYEHGGGTSPVGSYFEEDETGVDIDPYANTTQADMLFKLGISVDPDAMGLLPTYDTTGADLAREAYRLRSDATRGQFSGNLLDLTQQSQQQQAGSLFAGHGGISRAMADVRQDVLSGYGQAAHEQYLDLTRDIHGIETGYERELVSAVGDLDPADYTLPGEEEKEKADCESGCNDTYQNCVNNTDPMYYQNCTDAKEICMSGCG